MSQGLSWKYVFNGSQCFVVGRRKQDARQVAIDYGYKFYSWVDTVYWAATDETIGIMLLVHTMRNQERVFDQVNLYSNGIYIGTDEMFCATFLPEWRRDGLTHIYLTVHSLDPVENAKIYGVKSYPDLGLIVYRIHKAGLKVRANVVLNTNAIGTYEKFVLATAELGRIGFDSCAAWCLRNEADEVDARTAPSNEELDKMEEWQRMPVGSSPSQSTEKRSVVMEGDKLTLFPDGTLSNHWCK
jgi:hypothetical protein